MRQMLSALKTKLLGQQKPKEERRRRNKDNAAPMMGEYVIYHHLKMQVTETRTDELWKWLWKHGWRVARFRNDRRSYTVLPENMYEKLDLASTSDRPVIIRSLMRK